MTTMDRDDHALSLVRPQSQIVPATAITFDAAFGKLPAEVKTEVLAKAALMRAIAAASKVLPACREIAAKLNGQRGMSADRLSDLFYKWAPEPRGQGLGAAALIDHRKCGSIANEGACGVIGCTRPRYAVQLHELMSLHRALGELIAVLPSAGQFVAEKSNSTRSKQTKKTGHVTPQDMAAYREQRQAKAMTIGSEWVYFRNGDEAMEDPWCACGIRIVEASMNGRVMKLYAVRCDDTSPQPERRRVAYSELW